MFSHQECAAVVEWPSNNALRAARSFRLALLTALAMNGATKAEKPLGVPRLRNVIRVPPSAVVSQVYVVSIGNGPWAVRITNRSSGTNSITSYVYANFRPKK